MAYIARKKVSGKPAKVGLNQTANLNEQRCAPQVPDIRARLQRPYVVWGLMAPVSRATRIDSDLPSDPLSAAPALHTQTGIPSFMVGQLNLFKWQQLNTNGYGKFYCGENMAVYQHKIL